MEVRDPRFRVTFNGEEESVLRFWNEDTKLHFSVNKVQVLGASVLNKHKRYRLRKLPGQTYLVEADL